MRLLVIFRVYYTVQLVAPTFLPLFFLRFFFCDAESSAWVSAAFSCSSFLASEADALRLAVLAVFS